MEEIIAEVKSEAEAVVQKYETLREEIKNLELDWEKVKSFGRENVLNLVFEGGGIRGIAFGGAAQFLEEHGILQEVTGFAGSSAGAIVAAALAVGYTSREIIDLLLVMNFNGFKDDSSFVVMDIIRLFSQYGIYKGDVFFHWISDLLARKTGDPKITFKQILERYKKKLVITGSCLNRAQSFYFNADDPKYADMPVALAVRISMSIPAVWKAVNLNGDIMVDGGVLNNYPLFVFDGKYIGDCHVTEEMIATSKTIGFKLMTSNERTDDMLYHVNEKIDGPISYAKALINALLIQIERGHIRSGYWERTVCINTHDVSSLDLTLDKEHKELLVDEGYIAAKNYFHCKMENLENQMNRWIVR